MENDITKNRLIEIVSLSKSFCDLCDTSTEYSRNDFIDRVLDILPRLYWNFYDIEAQGVILSDFDYMPSYVDQELYDNIRKKIAVLMGENDIYLDTFEQDMQYSETPISASVSEGMADIFQSLYDFINIVKDSEGIQLEDAYINCKENFENYWSQTLCNLLKVFNNLKYSHNSLNEDYD